MVSGMDVVPGQGIQFDELRNVLLLALVLYVAAAVLAVLQGRLLNRIVNRAVRRLRSDVEDKLHRLPLSYFDRQPRGEILSRATNDIDNIQQSMQQTLSQLLMSTLTVIGVVVMMVSISPLLASIALVTIPIVVLVDTPDRQALEGASSSPSGRTPAGSTGRSRRRSAATRWSRCSAGSARCRPASTPRTTSCTGRASAPSSSPG